MALDDVAQEPATDSSAGNAANDALGTPTAGLVAIAATEASVTVWPGYRSRQRRGPVAIPLERPPKA